MTAADAVSPSTGARPGSMIAVYSLALLTLISAFNYFDRSLLGLLLPLIKRDMHLSDTVLGLVTGFAFALFNVLMTIPVARLAERRSRRNIIAVGLAFWSLMTAASGPVANVAQLTAARFLMGLGEAAGVAPSNSLVADLFRRERRALTISILTAGNQLGTIAFIPIAAWIAHAYGWRAAFMAAGAPGLVLAALLVLTVPEPRRGASEPGAGQPSAERFGATLRFLLGSKAYLLLLTYGVLLNAATALSTAWWPAFLDRVHHAPFTQIGVITGPVRGVAGLAGIVLGGWLVDRLSRRDGRALFWVPAVAALLCAPSTLLFLMGRTLAEATAGLALASLFLAVTQGAAFAACSLLAKVGMRATSVAIFLFVGYLVGYSLGPLLVGMLNDGLQQRFGEAAIRYSLLTGVAYVVAGGLAALAACLFVDADTRRAREA